MIRYNIYCDESCHLENDAIPVMVLGAATCPSFAVKYKYFKADFVLSRPVYKGKKLALRKHPMKKGKEATFWHMISEGRIESDRVPDLRRCERIRWPKPIIEHSHLEASIKVWKNTRRNETRICIWLESQDYLIILADRKGYILFWTAYPVIQKHRKRKLQNEYERFINRA